MEYCVEDYLSYKLHMIKTNKFKTVNFKIIFSSKVIKEEITIKNFLSDILTHSCSKYKTRKALSIALEDLYAMNIFSNCYRIGKLYNMEIVSSFLNEKYTEDGMFEKSLDLISEIILNPNVSNGQFDSDAFNYVKELTATQINSIKEDTRKLSLINMLEHMDKDSEVSYHGFGYLCDMNKVTVSNLLDYYQSVIDNNIIDIYIISDIDFSKTKNIIYDKFKFKTLKKKKDDFIVIHKKIRKRPKKIVEEINVGQSKLSVGCKLDKLTKFERNYVLPIYSMILGGGSDSKLFKNVREHNSLCYYISASANKLDNILFITSGISASNFDKVLKLIKEAIRGINKGCFTSDEINKAKIQYITILEELQENPLQIISSYYSMELLDFDCLDKRKEQIQNVTYNDIKKLSNKIYMDTIYLLKGEE